jgi:hypothetical protein
LCTGLSAELAWRALTPSRSLGIDLVARRHDRSPAVDRLLDAADRIAGELAVREYMDTRYAGEVAFRGSPCTVRRCFPTP